MHQPLRTVVALLAALVALTALAAPSYAESLTVRDARGDLVTVVEGEVHTTPAPHARLGDILRTTFRHTARRVAVGLAFADLRPVGKRFEVFVDARTPGGRDLLLAVVATPRDRAGTMRLIPPHGGDVACAGMRHRIDYAADTVRASVPRRCLGDPPTLRFRVLTEQSRRSLQLAWIDNGLTTRHIVSRAWTPPLAAG